MTNDGSFDKLTGMDDFASDPALAPAVRLLREGAPVNGIDFVPRWREWLANEASRTVQPVAKWRCRALDWRPILRYAAVLACGIGIGGIALSAVAGGQGHSHGAWTVLSDNGPHYTDSQRNLMFAMLDAAVPPNRQTVERASMELGNCVACHDGGLRAKLAAWKP